LPSYNYHYLTLNTRFQLNASLIYLAHYFKRDLRVLSVSRVRKGQRVTRALPYSGNKGNKEKMDSLVLREIWVHLVSFYGSRDHLG